MTGNRSITNFIEGPEKQMADEAARTFALVAAKLALPEGEPGACSKMAGAVLLRCEAERLARKYKLDPLPPWPDGAPDRETWPEYGTGDRT